MTRFARATGSKGSNEKTPEEATSWQEMKTAMLSNTNNKKLKATIEEQCEEEVDVPTVEEIKSVWADLLSTSELGNSKISGKALNMNKQISKNNKVSKEAIANDEGEIKIKKNKMDFKNLKECSKIELGEISASKKRKKEKRKVSDTGEILSVSKKKRDDEVEQTGFVQALAEKKIKKKAKKVKNHEIASFESVKLGIYDGINHEVENKSKSAEESGKTTYVNTEMKPREKKRRKEALKASEVVINGRPVKIAPFDGFLVQAEDAARLRELRQSMKSKGIPESEREKAIKLERRRAEKALARLKKRVCFHCRGSGHNLSECPQVQEDQRSTGICYKCGSTEHTYFQCKVTRGEEFRFAECFICKEQGHIAKQCPDNPRGLYPRGGACATCGDVTHLKKDCPKYLAEKDEEKITVSTRHSRELEALEDDEPIKKLTPFNKGKKVNKHIKF